MGRGPRLRGRQRRGMLGRATGCRAAPGGREGGADRRGNGPWPTSSRPSAPRHARPCHRLSRRAWSPRGWRGAGASVLAQLAHASLLADLAAKVIELRAVHVADGAHLDLVDLRRMERERALDADAERVLPHREGLTRAGALSLDDDPL